MSTIRLASEDRSFFEAVERSVLSNPFGEPDEKVRKKLVPDVDLSKQPFQFLYLIKPAVEERLDRIQRKGLASLQDLEEQDRPLLGLSFLLRTYLRHVPDFDCLIDNQMRRPSEPASVAFADDALADLVRFGFTEQDATQYFAFFFQFRRAFHFIGDALVGDSPCMKKLRLALWNNVFGHNLKTYVETLWNRMEDFSTLLLGETGSGKGAAAAAIGKSGFIPFEAGKNRFAASFAETFTEINLSQFPENLVESELFGHRKGAFTGAVENHTGLLTLCRPFGSVFLDEIGEVSEPVQIKLLRVLQERTFSPVGEHKKQRFAGRVIAATNRPLTDLRSRRGSFRNDFFYRLCSDIITVPTLRQRIQESAEEIGRLVKLLILRMTGENNSDLAEYVLDSLDRCLPPGYLWPGNVRELEQAVRRILLTGRYSGDLAASGEWPENELFREICAGSLSSIDLVGRYCTLLYGRHGTYEEVARKTGLDRRTVKKYLAGRDKTAEKSPPSSPPLAEP